MTTQVPPTMLALPGGLGYRNKVINGCGWIDQRNNNAPVTVNSPSVTFGPDRWSGFGATADGVFVLTGSKATSDPLGAGMPSCVIAQTTTIDSSIGATQSYGIRYCIEGQDVAPWRIGTAQAALATLSFRALSSKAGTHCVALMNSANSRSYVATYTIAQAGVWQTVSLPIQMDTTGTWLTDNGVGIRLIWNLGAGSNFVASTENTWGAGQRHCVAGAQNVIDTLSAYLAVTDVQLEQGGAPGPFEQRPLATELSLCQRYYETGKQPYFYGAFAAGIATGYGEVRYAATKRAAPTSVGATGWQYFSSGSGTSFTPAITSADVDRFYFQGTGLTNWGGWTGVGTWTANAEL